MVIEKLTSAAEQVGPVCFKLQQ